MEEKILIENTPYKLHKNILIVLTILTVILFIILMLYYGIYDHNTFSICFICSIPVFIPLAIYLIMYAVINGCKLVITDKRIYGTTIFRKRVDLPIDSISAIGTSMLGGVDVGTSSGRIHFKFIKNKNEIHSVLSKLLMERQQKKANAIAQSASNADELKKYKDLFDSGVISQAEFDAKKKQLLNL